MPPEITKIVGTKFAFKVFMDKFNATKLLPVFNVLRMSADPAIIESLHAAETPVKVTIYLFHLLTYILFIIQHFSLTELSLIQQTDNEATSGCVPVVSPFVSFVPNQM